MENQENIVAKGKRPRIRHYQREEVIESQTTRVEEGRRRRESLMQNPPDEDTSRAKDSEQ